MTGPKPFGQRRRPAFAGVNAIARSNIECELAQGDADFVARLPDDEWNAIAAELYVWTTQSQGAS